MEKGGNFDKLIKKAKDTHLRERVVLISLYLVHYKYSKIHFKIFAPIDCNVFELILNPPPLHEILVSHSPFSIWNMQT